MKKLHMKNEAHEAFIKKLQQQMLSNEDSSEDTSDTSDEDIIIKSDFDFDKLFANSDDDQ